MMSMNCRFRKSIRAMSCLSSIARRVPACLRANATAAFYPALRRRDRNTFGVSDGSAAGEPAGRPRPREVVAADRAEGVEQLAAQEQPGVPAALHGAGIDLLERDAAARHLGLAEALV